MEISPRKYEDSTFAELLEEGKIDEIINNNIKAYPKSVFTDEEDRKVYISEILQHNHDQIDAHKDHLSRLKNNPIAKHVINDEEISDIEKFSHSLESDLKFIETAPEMVIMAYHHAWVFRAITKLELCIKDAVGRKDNEQLKFLTDPAELEGRLRKELEEARAVQGFGEAAERSLLSGGPLAS